MRAFSLVELSIVLVILGLLTGGILAGQSLIRAAELRAATTEYGRWASAIHSFRGKYMAIPGDMQTATRFWGDDPGSCPDSTVTDGSPGTCNGNGNNTLQSIPGSNERFQFWKQLALAGLIEGAYSGLQGSEGYDTHAILGSNVPASKLSNAGWSVHYAKISDDSRRLDYDYGNHFSFGAATANSAAIGAVLRPEEAWNIDTKLDDGHPGHGKVIGVYWNNACMSPTSGAAASGNLNVQYRLTDSNPTCALIFRDAF